MNWIADVVRPRIKTLFRKDSPENLWVKCPDSGQMVFARDVEANMGVIPGSEHHTKLSANARLRSFLDEGPWEEVAVREVAQDPLKFRDEKRYADRLKEARARTGMVDAVKVVAGTLEGLPLVVAVQDFAFLAGTLGLAAGEAVIAAADAARERRVPLVLFAASGGARMQEGVLALMQMARTTLAVRKLREAGLPYVVVLTNPTTGGVTASYAMLGDVHVAEPGALVGFAGPRVIEQTIREVLPEGFQRAEYLKAHGMVDMVVHRHQLRPALARLLRLLTRAPAREVVAEEGRESDAEGSRENAREPAPVAA